MFTGIVQATGRIREARPTVAGLRLVIDPLGWDHRSEPGESIAVSGCCLTLVGPARDGSLDFDAVAETLAKTTLGGLRPGDAVNLERSLRASDLLGGHFVQGHVDGVGAIERVETGAERRVTIRPPPALMVYMVPKGSVAIDGVSLTIAGTRPDRGVIDVALIPVTLERTTLGSLRAGDRVNVEADAIAKTVVHALSHLVTPAGAPRVAPTDRAD